MLRTKKQYNSIPFEQELSRASMAVKKRALDAVKKGKFAVVQTHSNQQQERISSLLNSSSSKSKANASFCLPYFLLLMTIITFTGLLLEHMIVGGTSGHQIMDNTLDEIKILEKSADTFVHSTLNKLRKGDLKKDAEQEQTVKNNQGNHKGKQRDESIAPLLTADGTLLHMVFSTDCSSYQHWQAYLMFHSAMEVNQPGYVTRIASGCSKEEAKIAKEWHEKHITKPMSNRFIIHFTPHFSSVKDKDGNTKGDYKFFNKPFGVLHWMENGIDRKGSMADAIVILIDPDMLLLRPVTHDFSDERDTIINKNRILRPDDPPTLRKVKHGYPFAQIYGFGNQWKTKLDLKKVTSDDNSPALKVSKSEASKFYPVGPPYLATVSDMYKIAVRWVEFVPEVHKQYPHLLAEMFAFCVAAAHLKLPHQLIDSLMISNVGAGTGGGEGWALVDAIPEKEGTKDFCTIAMGPPTSSMGLSPTSPSSPISVPSVVHFCQRYFIGHWFFSKRRMPKNFFTCESALLAEPPGDIVSTVDFGQAPGGDVKKMNLKVRKRNGFSVCSLIGAVNRAGEFFKKKTCSSTEMNMQKTLKLM